MTNKEEAAKWQKIYDEVVYLSNYFKYARALKDGHLQDVIHKVVAKLKLKEADGTVILDDYENYKHYMFIMGNNFVLQGLSYQNTKKSFLKKAYEFQPYMVEDNKKYQFQPDDNLSIQELNNKIDALPPYQNLALRYTMDGIPQIDIANYLGKTVGEVQSLLRKARKNFQKPYGYRKQKEENNN